MAEPPVVFESEPTQGIMYKFGNVCVKLEGFHAMLYRQMIWQYGKARATEKFWRLWH